MNRKNTRRVVVVMVGSILGAALGNAIGMDVHSANLPFFIMLGAVIGLCLSGVMSLVIARSREDSLSVGCNGGVRR